MKFSWSISILTGKSSIFHLPSTLESTLDSNYCGIFVESMVKNHRSLEGFLGGLLFKSCNLDYILSIRFTVYRKKKHFDSGDIFIQRWKIICISTYVVDLFVAYIE